MRACRRTRGVRRRHGSEAEVSAEIGPVSGRLLLATSGRGAKMVALSGSRGAVYADRDVDAARGGRLESRRGPAGMHDGCSGSAAA